MEVLDALAVWSFDFPAAIISWSLRYGIDCIEFNVTVRSYLDFNTTVLLAMSAIDEFKVPLSSDVQYILLGSEETVTVTLRITSLWSLTGTYYWQINLLTGEPSKGGYTLEYIEGTLTVT